MSAIQMHQWQSLYPAARHAASREGPHRIFAAGTSNPFLHRYRRHSARARNQGEVIAKATKCDGVYDKDPMQFPEPSLYQKSPYTEVLTQSLGVMDATRLAMCREQPPAHSGLQPQHARAI